MNKIEKNHIAASDGMTLVRLSNGEPMGKELWLGKTYWVGGERVTPFDDVADNFGEITDEQAELQQYTYKATDAISAVAYLYEASQWVINDTQQENITITEEDAEDYPKPYCHDDESKMQMIDKYGGIATTDYASLVTAFVRVRYSADDMEAIVNNYLNNEALDEWSDMQRWRTSSKELAKDIIRLTTKE